MVARSRCIKAVFKLIPLEFSRDAALEPGFPGNTLRLLLSELLVVTSTVPSPNQIGAYRDL